VIGEFTGERRASKYYYSLQRWDIGYRIFPIRRRRNGARRFNHVKERYVDVSQEFVNYLIRGNNKEL
jgi:hypothetical protein